MVPAMTYASRRLEDAGQLGPALSFPFFRPVKRANLAISVARFIGAGGAARHARHADGTLQPHGSRERNRRRVVWSAPHGRVASAEQLEIRNPSRNLTVA